MITNIRWSRKILIPGIKGYKWSRRVQKRAKHDCIQIYPNGLSLMELDSIWVQAKCCMQLEKQYQHLVNNWAKPTVGKNHAIEGSETAWHPLAKVSFDLHLIKGRQTFNRPFNSLLSLFDWIWKVGRIYFLWTCINNRAKI